MAYDQKTYDATLAELEAIMKEKGDSFFIKIQRREDETAFTYPITWATFEGCTLNHIAFRESWLEQLAGAGGGVFELVIHHSAAPMRAIGSPIRALVKAGNLMAPNLTVLDLPDWKGPKTLKYPDRKVVAQINPMGVASPGGSNPLPQSPIQSVPTYQDARNEASRNGGTDPAATNRLLDAASQLAKQKEELQEQRRLLELQRVQSEFEVKLAAVMAKLEVAKNAAPVAPQKNIIDQIVELLPVITPLATAFMASRGERDKMMMDAQKEAAERQAKAMEALAAKLAEKNTSTFPDQSATMMKMSEVMSSMMGMSFQVMHQAQEAMGQQQPDNPVVTAIGQVMDTIKELGSVYMKTARPAGAPAVNLPRLPPGNTATAATTPSAAATPASTVDEMEQMIRAHTDPKQVVDHFFKVLPGKEMQEALTAVGGDPADLIKIRLGAWLIDAKNFAYISSIRELIETEASARGFNEPAAEAEVVAEKVAPAPAAATNNVVPMKPPAPQIQVDPFS